MTTASTHTGICQACGRRQAVHVKTGMIAKHGYTTEYGFFNGTCGGSDALPLELDTTVNVATVAAMVKFADEQEAQAAGEILKVAVEVGHQYRGGRRIAVTQMMDRAEFEATQPRYRNFDDAVELVRMRLRRTAEIVRADAEVLDALRDRVHGQPLQPRAVEVEIKRETFKAIREAYARQAELKAQGIDARIRRGTYVGQPHTVTYR
jgi:hypothetical protein